MAGGLSNGIDFFICNYGIFVRRDRTWNESKIKGTINSIRCQKNVYIYRATICQPQSMTSIGTYCL